MRVACARPYVTSTPIGKLAAAAAEAKRCADLRAAANVIDDGGKPRAVNPPRMSQLDTMHAREQITRDELDAAMLFQVDRDRRAATEALGAYAKLVQPILLADWPVSSIRDARVSHRKGVTEAMSKLRAGLRLLVQHYGTDAPDIEPPPSTAAKLMALDKAFASEVADAGRAMPRKLNLEGGWSMKDNFRGFVNLKGRVSISVTPKEGGESEGSR